MFVGLAVNVAVRSKLVYYRIKGYRAIHDPRILKEIDPRDITHFISSAEFESDPPKFGLHPGDWDRRAYPFEENAIYDQFVAHFENGVAWEETDRYRVVVNRLEKGGRIGALDTEDQSVETYEHYLDYLDRLYQSIESDGYLTQQELQGDTAFVRQWPVFWNEIRVFIGRDGTLICRSGKHPLTLCRILDLDSVPVAVTVRHPEWQQLRETIVADGANLPREELDSLCEHPDLRELDWSQ